MENLTELTPQLLFDAIHSQNRKIYSEALKRLAHEILTSENPLLSLENTKLGFNHDENVDETRARKLFHCLFYLATTEKDYMILLNICQKFPRLLYADSYPKIIQIASSEIIPDEIVNKALLILKSHTLPINSEILTKLLVGTKDQPLFLNILVKMCENDSKDEISFSGFNELDYHITLNRMLKISFTKGIKVLKHLAKSKIIDKVWEDFNPYGFSDYQTRRIKRVFYSNLWQKEIKQVDYNSQTDIENFTFNTRFIDAEHALIIYRHMIKKIFTNNLRIFWSILGQYFNILAGDVSFVPKKEAKFLQKITSPITFGTISKYWSRLIIIKKNDPELTELYKNWLVKNQEFFNPQDSETLENVIPALSPEENKDIYTYFFNACEPPKLNVKHVVPIAIKYLQNQYEKDANVEAKCLDILFDLMPIGSLEFQKEFLQYIKDNYINEQYSQMNLPFILAGYFLKKYPNPGFTAEEFDIKSIFENKKQQELEEEIKVQEILKLLKF